MNKTALGRILGVAVSMVTLAGAHAASNTLVRFHFSHGTTAMGDVVVELFDQDKPVTVQNFLKYVRVGAYDDLMLHRCEPGFVIQGGAVRNPTPRSTAFFSSYREVSHFDPITNEFAVGPQYSNVFGTLAMARLSNPTNAAEYVTNSASSDWFFNLGNNSTNLDNAGGGFTVFGRVVSGTNVLNYFNSLSLSNRLLDLRYFYGANFSLFKSTPVSFPGFRLPRFSELITVKVTSLSSSDVVRPKITVTTPRPNGRLTNEAGDFTFTGTASDNLNVGWVWYSLNFATETNASGTTEWSTTVPLPPGTNHFSVQSVDEAGNRSPAVAFQVFRVVPFPLDLHITGQGTVKGATHGQVLEVNRNYLLTAVPAAGHRFVGWDAVILNDTNSSPQFVANPQVIITMQSNLSLIANFVTNPFPPLKGAYVGAFFNVSNFLERPAFGETIGTVSFNVTEQGKVSGRIKQGNGSYPFSGAFSTRGSAVIRAARAGLNPLEIQLTLDVTNRSIEVPMLISDNVTWGAYGKAIRAASGTSVHPSSFAGQYTVALPGGTNSATSPPGQGPGTVKIGNSGILNFTGTLADGTPVTQGTPITTNGLWPFYLTLYGGKGAVFSWAQFDANQPNDDVRGPFVWLKRSTVPSPIYPAGFLITNILTGSHYRVPEGTTNRVLQLTNAQFAFTDGNLAAAVTNDVTLLPNNTITNLTDLTLKVTFTKANGLFTGSFIPPEANKAVTFKGAVHQKRNNGTGYFRGTNQTGSVFLGPSTGSMP